MTDDESAASPPPEGDSKDMAPATDGVVTMYRPVGPAELSLLKVNRFRQWPSRLPGQPIFYPVTNFRYASDIASNWNVKDSGCGYVTVFEVRKSFADRFPLQRVGAPHAVEWWIPAEDVADLNRNIIGMIRVLAEFGDTARGAEVLRDLVEEANSPDFTPISLRASFAASIVWDETFPDRGRLMSCARALGYVDVGAFTGRESRWSTALVLAPDGCTLEAEHGFVVQFLFGPDEFPDIRPGAEIPFHLGGTRIAVLRLGTELFPSDLVTRNWKMLVDL